MEALALFQSLSLLVGLKLTNIVFKHSQGHYDIYCLSTSLTLWYGLSMMWVKNRKSLEFLGMFSAPINVKKTFQMLPPFAESTHGMIQHLVHTVPFPFVWDHAEHSISLLDTRIHFDFLYLDFHLGLYNSKLTKYSTQLGVNLSWVQSIDQLWAYTWRLTEDHVKSIQNWITSITLKPHWNNELAKKQWAGNESTKMRKGMSVRTVRHQQDFLPIQNRDPSIQFFLHHEQPNMRNSITSFRNWSVGWWNMNRFSPFSWLCQWLLEILKWAWLEKKKWRNKKAWEGPIKSIGATSHLMKDQTHINEVKAQLFIKLTRSYFQCVG